MLARTDMSTSDLLQKQEYMKLMGNHCPSVSQPSFAFKVNIQSQLNVKVEYIPCYKMNLESLLMLNLYSSWRVSNHDELLGCSL